jgi:hypothetical protein
MRWLDCACRFSRVRDLTASGELPRASGFRVGNGRTCTPIAKLDGRLIDLRFRRFHSAATNADGGRHGVQLLARLDDNVAALV